MDMKTGKSGEFQLRRNAYSRPRSICGAAASSTSVKKKKTDSETERGGGAVFLFFKPEDPASLYVYT